MASIIKVDTIQTAAGGTPTAADLGLNTTGSVLQVVQGTSSTQVDVTSSGSWTSLSLSASITPSSTSSKILITGMWYGGPYKNAGSDADMYVGISRDAGSTFLFEGNIRAYDYGGSGLVQWSGNAINYLDSPSSTSSLTYALYGYLITGEGLRINDGNTGPSTITLMEIAG